LLYLKFEGGRDPLFCYVVLKGAEMSVEERENEIRKLLESNDFEVMEFRVEKRGKIDIVKIFIYTENGVNIADCASAARLINDHLYEEEYSGKNYRLEVSSPGLDRPLKTMKDFRRKLGKDVQVTFRHNDTTGTVKGKLVSVTESDVTLEDAAQRHTVLFADLINGKILLPW